MKKRLLAIGMTTTLGIAAFGTPAAAISEAGCAGLENARGLITVDLRGSQLEQLFEQLDAAIPGDEGPPQTAIYVPRVQLRNDCKSYPT